jgi:ubiquinone/menaquinone biosynthesis C-methylase UbiE
MLEYLDIQPGDYILDMGCGEGFYSMIFDQLYDCKVMAVDYDDGIMGLAKGWLKDSKKITFEKGDICNLRFADNTFDKIVCTEVLEHIVDHEKATSELYRVLKPGGTLAVTVPNKNYPFLWDPFNWIRESLGLGHFNTLDGFWGGIWAYDHKRLYLPEDLEKLMSNHKFIKQDLRVLTHWGLPFNHLILYTGKNMYTSLPVPDDVKNSMEKFKWGEETDSKQAAKTQSKSIWTTLINFGFSALKWADSFNNTEFPLTKSTMAVAMKLKK